MRDLLERDGYIVTEARTACRRSIRSIAWTDIIVLVEFPVWTLWRAVAPALAPGHRNIPVIVLTAKAMKTRSRVFELGADDFPQAFRARSLRVSKPCSPPR